MKAAALAAVLAALAAQGAAFGDEFDRIVKAIETHYGAEPVHIPLLGVANLVLTVAHPKGASGFRLAVFENLRDLKSSSDPFEWNQRDRFMATLEGPNLRPLVRVHSRRNEEATYIFMSPESTSRQSTRVLIATFQPDQATVVEVKASLARIFKSLADPEHAGRELEDDR